MLLRFRTSPLRRSMLIFARATLQVAGLRIFRRRGELCFRTFAAGWLVGILRRSNLKI